MQSCLSGLKLWPFTHLHCREVSVRMVGRSSICTECKLKRSFACPVQKAKPGHIVIKRISSGKKKQFGKVGKKNIMCSTRLFPRKLLIYRTCQYLFRVWMIKGTGGFKKLLAKVHFTDSLLVFLQTLRFWYPPEGTWVLACVSPKFQFCAQSISAQTRSFFQNQFFVSI